MAWLEHSSHKELKRQKDHLEFVPTHAQRVDGRRAIELLAETCDSARKLLALGRRKVEHEDSNEPDIDLQ